MGASGFASLGYQIVWTQQSAVWLGHETAAVLAVVAAFFGGLALGAIALGDRIEQSTVPQRWYAACEAAIAVWSVALAVLMNPLGEGLLDLIGAQPSAMWHWMAAFCGTFALLLPATVAMGATLPAMERVIAKLQMQSQRSGQPGGHAIGALYASNTVGAVVGVLATAFWLIPTFGLLRTAGLCAAINLACAAAALGLRSEGTPTIAPTVAPTTPAGRRLAATLVATGLLGIGYEVLVVRVLSQVTEDTVYTFAMLLAVYLAGTALGAAAYQHWGSGKQGSTVPPDSETDPVRDRLLGLLAVASLLATLGLYGAPALKAFALDAMGPGMTAALGAEAALALAAFGLPTVVMGALFSHLTVQARATGLAFSRSLAFNTLGAAAAPLIFGVLLLPALGPKLALLGVAGGYLALSSPSAWRAPWVWVPAAMTLALALLAPPLMFIDTPAGGHVVSYREGAMSSVSVIEDARGVMRLRIDNRQQEGSSDSRVADARQALLPLLLHPAPKQALFLGLGTGVTSFSAAEDPSLHVDVVELLPEVIAASDHFTRGLTNGKATPHRKLMAADARRYVRAASKQYDVIVSDNFHPARSGSAALYTVEHFQAVQKRLAAGGLFCQWLPLHQLDLDSLRAVVQAFMAVYPDGWAMLATNSLETPVMGLVGRVGATHFDGEQMHARLAAATWPQALADFGLPDEMAVMGNFIAGPQSLVRFAGNAQANTDDHPVVAYSAPRITYAPDSLPRDRLVSLLQALGVTPEDLRRATPDAATRQRLAAYWDARNRYIVIGRTVRPSGNVENMLAQVREPLLSVLRTSPDFRPAYDPLLRMATALTQINATQGRKLLTELAQVQPKRPEAAQALRELNGN